MPPVFAGDEAGDVSFAFDKGASTHFVIALISTAQPDVLRQALFDLRVRRGLPTSYEFKFHKLSGAELRRETFTTLETADFDIWALVVDKTCLPTYWQGLDAHDFYALTAAELLLRIPLVHRESATLLLDEFDPRDKALLALKRALKRRTTHRGLRKMINVRSRSESLVQIADLVAGSILRSVAYDDDASLAAIKAHVKLLYQFEASLEQKNPPS